MTLDAETLFTFLLVLCRCGAMFLTSPVLGGPTTPVSVRAMFCMVMAGSLTFYLKGSVPIPDSMGELVLGVGREIAFGVLIGGLTQLVFQGMLMAGSLVDLQMGLGISQALNPVTGVPVSVVAQFKYFLCLVIFLLINGHHLMLNAFVATYQLAPGAGVGMEAMYHGVVGLLIQASLLAVQVALPIIAVTMVVDAAFGIMNKAVPTMHTLLIGVPAKTLLGLTAVTMGLPMLVGYTQANTRLLFGAIERTFMGVP